MASSPNASKICGGLRILTSRPYALCHQLSNGAEVIIATPPQAQMNAPSGPRNPHIVTDTSHNAEFFLKVVERIRYPQVMPASTPHNWISKCAGVQNVSRPMLLCHEMSQTPPMALDVMAATQHHTYQGIAAVRAATRSRAPAASG